MPRVQITETRRTRQELDVQLPQDYTALAEDAEQIIRRLTRPYPKAIRAFEYLLNDPAVDASWSLANYIAVMKMNYNDHGPIHARVAAAAAMRILSLLVEAEVPLDMTVSGAGSVEDSFVSVLVGSLLHDVGHQIHRTDHVHYGVMLARELIQPLYEELYEDREERQLVESFTLACVACHDCTPPPLTIEGGVVAVADGTDMTKGRGRMAFDLGKIDIHAVSALAIEEVRIGPGEHRPVEVEILMSNSAGIFQVEEILVRKLLLTPLKPYVTVIASTIPQEGSQERRILHRLTLEGERLSVERDEPRPAGAP